LSGTAGAERTVKLTAPSAAVLAVPNNRQRKVVTPSRSRFVLDEVATRWVWTESEGALLITLGVTHLQGLETWLSKPAVAFDTSYGIAPPLWFWGTIGR
jgi:hypothetical protein